MGVSRQCDPLGGPKMSQPRSGVDPFGSIFVEQWPQGSKCGEFFVGAVSSHPGWALIKTAGVVREEE